MFIVTKTIDGENISKLCRTCLREDNDKMVYLFIGPAGSSLATKLQSLSYLEVIQGDGLPEKMCDKCVTRAESALLFREQCRAADQALRQALIRVSKLANYETPQAYPYQRYENPMPLHNANIQNTSKYIDSNSYANNQDFYLHNRLHSSYFHKENESSHNMHIVESQNSFYNTAQYYNNGISNPESFIPSIMHQEYTDSLERASCALHCSLCNHTFSNRMQLASHNYTHSSINNLEISCDEIHVDVEENSNPADRNINYDRSADPDYENVHNFSNHKSVIDSSQYITNYNSTNSSLNNSNDEINITIPTSEDNHTLSDCQNFKVDENKFKCNKCSQVFNQKSKLIAHSLNHDGKKPFECLHCGKSYSSKSKLSAHVRLHTRTNIHQCNICQKIFTYPSYLTEHMKVHNSVQVEKKKIYECLECRKKFQFIKSYKRHIKIHEGRDLFNCDICDKVFSHKYSLKVHLQTHLPTKIHKCDVCNKTFNQKSNLVEHIRTHTKIKPFKCKLCEKSFSQSSHLKSHEASHNSTRQHQCRICGKSFKLLSHLKRHYNLHMGTKIYKCNQCDQTFSQAFSLKRHSKKHSEI